MDGAPHAAATPRGPPPASTPPARPTKRAKSSSRRTPRRRTPQPARLCHPGRAPAAPCIAPGERRPLVTAARRPARRAGPGGHHMARRPSEEPTSRAKGRRPTNASGATAWRTTTCGAPAAGTPAGPSHGPRAPLLEAAVLAAAETPLAAAVLAAAKEPNLALAAAAPPS